MKKSFLIFPLLFMLISCSTVNTKVYTPTSVTQAPTITIIIEDDSWNLENSISSRFESLGFKVIQKNDGLADFYAEIDYETFWDVIHQTFDHYDMRIISTKSNKEVLKTSYIGRLGFNNCEKALSLVFKDISKKINTGT